MALPILALSPDEPIYGNLDALPTLIAVHGIVSPDNGGELTVFFFLDEVEEVLAVTGSGTGGGVAPIAEEVDIGMGYPELFSGFEKGIEVSDVRVDAAVRDLGRHQCYF